MRFIFSCPQPKVFPEPGEVWAPIDHTQNTYEYLWLITKDPQLNAVRLHDGTRGSIDKSGNNRAFHCIGKISALEVFNGE